MKRASILACVSVCLVCCVAVAPGQGRAYPQAKRVAASDHSPLPEVRITPTTMPTGASSIEVGSDQWSAKGYDLKSLIAQIYDIDVRRVDVAESGDPEARYDLTASLPREVDEDELQRLLAEAIEKKFGLDVKPEVRSMLVYVMTAPNGAGAALHPHTFGSSDRKSNVSADDDDSGAGRITFFGADCTHVTANGVEVDGGTIADFRRTLEPDLDRVLIDETNLTGNYDFKIGSYADKDALFQLLRDQLGVVVRPAERKVTIIKVRPHDEFTRMAATTVPSA